MVHVELITLLWLPIEIKLSILLVSRNIAVHPYVGIRLQLGEYVLHIIHYHREIYVKELTLADRYLLSLILSTTTHLLGHVLQVAQI